MTTHLTEIDWSGKYKPRTPPGVTITNPDGSKVVQFGSRWAAIDVDGRIVTEIGAMVMFESVESANEFLGKRGGQMTESKDNKLKHLVESLTKFLEWQDEYELVKSCTNSGDSASRLIEVLGIPSDDASVLIGGSNCPIFRMAADAIENLRRQRNWWSLNTEYTYKAYCTLKEACEASGDHHLQRVAEDASKSLDEFPKFPGGEQ
jgi:hypothetical protein